jgi:hypothetical protein
MTKNTETNAVPAIKGMNPDMTCRGYQFEAGKTYTIEGPVKACNSGFHACPVDDETPPHAVFEYYAPGASRYFDVTASGSTDRDGSKVASASITIGVEITMGELMRRVAEWCVKKAKGAASNSGTRGAASNSGDYGAASNSGDYGAASNSGYGGAASNSGDYGAASNSGYGGAASNSGYGGAASNSGDYGAAFSHAYSSKVMCEGDGQALYCTEFADDDSIASVACGITGKNGIKAGVWYHAKSGKLVPVNPVRED